MERLSGRVATITGAASGLGRAMARRFATDGMRLVLADIEEEPLLRVADELRGQGAEVEALRCDVSQRPQIDALADAAYARFGAVHILCNNAGVAVGGPAWSHSENEWNWIVGVNLFGVIHGISAFVPRMLAAGDEGHIVNTASIAGLIAPGLMAAYCATKHAVVGISECLFHDLELAKSRLGVSVLCPGFVTTQIHKSTRNRPDELKDPAGSQHPMSQLMQGALSDLVEHGTAPEDVANAVVHAVQTRQFWVLTHPELDGAIKARSASLCARENPRAAQLVRTT
ncbi:MAG: SDR family NAD(P)-dependent oxidoreductase [Myxococcales bacterium]|nr:SDR family NAD(P)-dependent oxidoreductase [Myxococcales bacterium]